MPRPSNAYFNLRMKRKLWRKKRVPCHLCQLHMPLGDYESHMCLCHEINLRTQCPFCCGLYEWSPGEKCSERVGLHGLACLKQLCKALVAKKPFIPPPEDVPRQPCTLCSDPLQQGYLRHLDGREKHAEWADFYEDVGQEPEFLKTFHVPYHVRFTKESGLGHDIHAIFHAFQNGQFEWYHIMVRAEAWSEFKTCIASLPYVFFLPYWTLCDGKKKYASNEGPRDHRHMILLVDKPHRMDFKRVWRNRVKLPEVSAKWHCPIQTPFHLMNVLFYVSTPNAVCDGNPMYWPKESPNQTSHYWIRREMHPHAKWAMAGLFRDGYKQLLECRVRNMDAVEWYTKVTRKYRKMRIRIQHLNLTPHGCVVPFEKDIRPSRVVTLAENQTPDAPFLYHYEPNTFWVLEEHVAELEHLPFDAWCDYQREKGNCFVEALEPFEYDLRRKHSNMVNQLNRVRQNEQYLHQEVIRIKNQELCTTRKENADLKMYINDLQRKLNDTTEQLKQTNAVLDVFIPWKLNAEENN